MWKIIFGFSLAGAMAFLLSAVLLASTIRTLDVFVHDRYVVAILPSHLLLLSAVMFVATFAAWKAKGSRTLTRGSS
jgi:hypothetical protein